MRPPLSEAPRDSGTASFAALVDTYQPPAGHFDDLLTSNGTLRPHWETFAATAGDLGAGSLAHAAQRVAHQIHENGVTYNVYAAADGPGRPWTLDVLPAIVPAADWDAIERGLRQRARLLNAMAADLYGEQQLLRRGILPPALVLKHAGFLRAASGVRPPGGVFLHVVAFDVSRDATGVWRVVNTRTQAPSGLGYALENRATIARLFPDAMRALQTRPLSPFCDALQEALLANAPADEAPLAVLVTPGPFNETYFEHAYLARQLGMPLVQGSDLAVRQDRVFLKTVSGLRRVHAIWRRVDDDYCDPLELRPDSTLGVAGLVQAWRAGHVLVANAFGLGVLESPGLLAFLEPACELLLAESLSAPALSTRWCGEPHELEAAIATFGDGVIKPALNAPLEPVFGSDLDESTRAAWADRLRADPDAYVVQQFLPPSQAPTWHHGSLDSRALVVRTFLFADGRGDYVLMPGGLARIAGDHRHTVSAQYGGGSKDTWVLSATPTDPVLRPIHPPRTALSQTTSSRAAEHLFWLGRYAERSENVARLLRAILQRTTEAGSWPAAYRLVFARSAREQGLVTTHDPSLGSHAPLPAVDDAGHEATASDDGTWSIERALIGGLFDRNSCRSLGFAVDHTLRVAGSVRERLSPDNWRVLNQLSQRLDGPPSEALDLGDVLELIDDAIVSLVAVGGLEMAHMTRDDGWRFLSIGRHLERLSFVSATIDDVIVEHATDEPGLLEWLLDLSDSLSAYRARHLRRPEWPAVMDLLFFDQHNPRSALFQMAKLAKHVRLLPDADLIDVLEGIDRLLASGRPDVRQGHLFTDAGRSEDLPCACGRLAGRLSEALTFRYFSHVHESPHATGAR